MVEMGTEMDLSKLAEDARRKCAELENQIEMYRDIQGRYDINFDFEVLKIQRRIEQIHQIFANPEPYRQAM